MNSHLLRAGISLGDFINQDYDESLTVEQMAKLRNMRRQALHEALKTVQAQVTLNLPEAEEERKLVEAPEVPVRILRRFVRDELLQVLFDTTHVGTSELSFVDCSDEDFSELTVNYVDFVNSNLLRTDFTDSSFFNVKFDSCNLEGASFRNTIIRDCSFVGACLRSADFHYALFRHIDLRCADMTGAIVGTDGRLLVSLENVNSQLLTYFSKNPLLTRDDELGLYGSKLYGPSLKSWASMVVATFGKTLSRARDYEFDCAEKYGIEGAASLIYAYAGSNPIPDWRLSVEDCMDELKRRADLERK